MWIIGTHWIKLRFEDFGVFCFLQDDDFAENCWQTTLRQTMYKMFGLMRLWLILCSLKIVSHCVTFWHSLDKIKMRRPLKSFVSFKMMIERTDKEGKGGPSFTIVGWFLPGEIHSGHFCIILSIKYEFSKMSQLKVS